MLIHGLHIREGANLPHWSKDGAKYSVTMRLADSLPQHVLQSWIMEKEEILTKAKEGKELSSYECHQLEYYASDRIERYLDTGHGECLLQKDEIAQIVANSIMYFHEERYEVIAWCIMPNHVHVVVQPDGEYPLEKMLYSWKHFTARKINELCNRSGFVWQAESFDHMIRNDSELEKQIDYVWSNPDKAGLNNWRWRWKNNAY